MNVTIVDYQSGNISSVINSFTEVAKGKVNLEVTSDIKKIKSSDKIVLPGQGSFKSCVDSLNKINGLVETLKDFAITNKKPLLGICVGLQMFADIGYEEAERIFKKYERLRNRRNQPAKVLSGGERRLLEISRALVMKPSVLLVDEPSIGLEPKYISMVFEILEDLQKAEKKTIILVEQNAKKGLEFADIGYVLVSGQTAIAGKGNDLLKNPDVGRLFLGG